MSKVTLHTGEVSNVDPIAFFDCSMAEERKDLSGDVSEDHVAIAGSSKGAKGKSLYHEPVKMEGQLTVDE